MRATLGLRWFLGLVCVGWLARTAVAPDEHGNAISGVSVDHSAILRPVRSGYAPRSQRSVGAGNLPATTTSYVTDDGMVRSLMGLVSDAGLKPRHQWSALQSLQSGSMQSRAAVQDSTMGDLKQCGLKVGHARKILEMSKQPPNNTPIQRAPPSSAQSAPDPNTAVSWSRPLQCIDKGSTTTTHHLLSKDFRKITTYTNRSQRSPMCFAPSKARCFRASVDNFATLAETEAVADAFRCKCTVGEEKCSEDNCPTGRKKHAEHPVMRTWEQRIRSILASEFEIPLQSVHLHNVRCLRFAYSSTLVIPHNVGCVHCHCACQQYNGKLWNRTAERTREEAVELENRRLRAWQNAELPVSTVDAPGYTIHWDSARNPEWLWTGLVYISDNSTIGGDLMFLDQGTPNGAITGGDLMQAANGRLVLFSSGPENVHGPTTLLHGFRGSFAFFFSCITDQSRASWDHPQDR